MIWLSRCRRVMHPDELLIIAGAPNRQKPTEQTRLMHVQSVYSREGSGIIHNLDLALLRIRDQDTLELNLTFNLGIASLATFKSSGYLRCTRFGWERAETNESVAAVLAPRTLQLMPQKFCLSLFPAFYRTHWLCATAVPGASQNVCGGDPGGPLFCGGRLAGIYMRDAMCSRLYPALFVSIAAYYDWIQKALSGAQKVLPLHFILWLSLRIF